MTAPRVAWRRNYNILRVTLQAASKVLKQTLAATEGLTSLAERGRIVPEIDDPSIREIFVHSYRLIYEVRIDQVTILAILHGARDFAKWQDNN